MRPTPDDYAEARKLLASVFDAPPAARLTAARYQHDHDDELGMYWYQGPPATASTARTTPTNHAVSSSTECSLDAAADDARDVALLIGELIAWERPRPRDQAYWNQTGRLVMEYFALQAGDSDSEILREGFIGWLKRSPAERRQYVNGDDMRRASVVDWYLRLVR